MISVYCFLCFKELDKPGAIILGVPSDDDVVAKFHLCRECSIALEDWANEQRGSCSCETAGAHVVQAANRELRWIAETTGKA